MKKIRKLVAVASLAACMLPFCTGCDASAAIGTYKNAAYGCSFTVKDTELANIGTQIYYNSITIQGKKYEGVIISRKADFYYTMSGKTCSATARFDWITDLGDESGKSSMTIKWKYLSATDATMGGITYKRSY